MWVLNLVTRKIEYLPKGTSLRRDLYVQIKDLNTDNDKRCSAFFGNQRHGIIHLNYKKFDNCLYETFGLTSHSTRVIFRNCNLPSKIDTVNFNLFVTIKHAPVKNTFVYRGEDPSVLSESHENLTRQFLIKKYLDPINSEYFLDGVDNLIDANKKVADLISSGQLNSNCQLMAVPIKHSPGLLSYSVVEYGCVLKDYVTLDKLQEFAPPNSLEFFEKQFLDDSVPEEVKHLIKDKYLFECDGLINE